MKKALKKKLERKGWKVGSAADFLGLSPEEEALVAIKMELVDALRQRRRKSDLTQAELAKRIGSSQSRVAKMEAGDPSVSIELVIRALLAIGVRPKRIAEALV
jgi:DNA-binding XRE family transcriptional regulator